MSLSVAASVLVFYASIIHHNWSLTAMYVWIMAQMESGRCAPELPPLPGAAALRVCDILQRGCPPRATAPRQKPEAAATAPAAAT